MGTRELEQGGARNDDEGRCEAEMPNPKGEKVSLACGNEGRGHMAQQRKRRPLRRAASLSLFGPPQLCSNLDRAGATGHWFLGRRRLAARIPSGYQPDLCGSQLEGPDQVRSLAHTLRVSVLKKIQISAHWTGFSTPKSLIAKSGHVQNFTQLRQRVKIRYFYPICVGVIYICGNYVCMSQKCHVVSFIFGFFCSSSEKCSLTWSWS